MAGKADLFHLDPGYVEFLLKGGPPSLKPGPLQGTSRQKGTDKAGVLELVLVGQAMQGMRKSGWLFPRRQLFARQMSNTRLIARELSPGS